MTTTESQLDGEGRWPSANRSTEAFARSERVSVTIKVNGRDVSAVALVSELCAADLA